MRTILCFLLLSLLLATSVHAQTNPGFIDGAVLCANAGQPACSSSPANPLSLNQAFMNKLDVTNGRTKLTAALNLYADFVVGNDANPCSMAAPCKTVQQIYNNIVANYDTGGQAITINVLNNDTACLAIISSWVGGGPITIQGPGGPNAQPTVGFTNCANPTTGAPAGTAIYNRANVPAVINIFNMVLASTANAAVVNNGTANIVLTNVVFNNLGSTTVFMLAQGNGARISCVPGVSVPIIITMLSGAPILGQAQFGGEINCSLATWAMIGAQTYSTAVFVSNDTGIVRLQNSFCNAYGGTCVAPTTITGVRYQVTMNGIIDTGTGNVNTIPGSSPGTTSLGGQYN
jgi:hypothetical protein